MLLEVAYTVSIETGCVFVLLEEAKLVAKI